MDNTSSMGLVYLWPSNSFEQNLLLTSGFLDIKKAMQHATESSIQKLNRNCVVKLHDSPTRAAFC